MRKGWQTKTLEEVCAFSNGLWKGEKPPFVNVGVIRNTNFTKEGTLDDSDIAYLDVEAKKLEKRRLQFGDIILEKSGGGPKQPVGRVVLFDKEDGNFSFSNFTAALRVLDAGELDFRFLHKFLHWTYLSGVTEGMQSHSTGIRNLDGDAYKAIKISFPSPPEQQRIVGLLDEAFAGLATAKANAEKNLQNARALFESHLQSVFTQRGKGWVPRQLASLCHQITVGHVGSMKTEYKGSGVPFLRSQNIRPFEVSIDNTMFIDKAFHRALKKSQLRPGDLAIVRTGYPGTAAVIPPELPDSNCSDLVIVRPSKEVNPHFLAAFFNSAFGKQLVLGKLVGAAQKHFNITAAKQVMLHVPPVAEQSAIVGVLDSLRAETQRLASLYERKVAALEALKKSLLHQTFSGELTKQSHQSVLVSFPTKIPSITTTDLHAGILATAYDRHERNNLQKHFGHVKAEKIAHMVEAHVGIDLGRAPIKDAAGPNDYPHQLSVEHRARKAGYFDFKRDEGAGYQVKKLRRFDELVERTRDKLGNRNQEIDSLLELMLPMNTQQAEIFCTVYAAWNNLLLDGAQPSDEQIVLEARENWHTAKLRIPRDKFSAAIDWLREKGIVPSGKGRKVAAKSRK